MDCLSEYGDKNMLLHLIGTPNDRYFGEIFQAIKRSLWPGDAYRQHVEDGESPPLPRWSKAPVARQRTREIEEGMVGIVEYIAGKKRFYELFDVAGELQCQHKLPFVERYHKYFAERQWITPLRDPEKYYTGLFRLDPLGLAEETAEEVENTNYSRHADDYNHFLNVVAAMARLIDYFSDPSRARDLLVKPSLAETEAQAETYSEMARVVAYGDARDKRVLRLMLAAFYHDIGKTVVYHRHAMEGASILAGHTSNALMQFDAIVKDYDPSWSFERDDLLFVAGMVFYHDQFGTLSTGEAGYLRLVEVVDRLKRASTVVGRESRADQIRQSNQYLFDLWLLNLADIIVSVEEKSVGKKWQRQEVWDSRSASNKVIEEFLQRRKEQESSKAVLLVHDLWIAMKLLAVHNESWHSDNLADLERQAWMYASRHVVERIARLFEASLLGVAYKKIEQLTLGAEKKNCRVIGILRQLCKLPRQTRETVILRCVQSVSNFAEFSARFAWIGQMDYALGFFRQIAERALDRVVEQLCDSGSPTGWVNDDPVALSNEARRNSIDAEFLTDNFALTVVQILEYLLFRDHEINQLHSIEFEDAGKRLTKEKIDMIIGMEGPYRARASIEFILQTIFVY